MKVEGEFSFESDRETVWNSMLSPDILSSCIPGCEKFEPTGEDSYDIVLNVGIGAIRGKYTGTIAIVDKQHLESFKMVVEGKGSGGSIRGEGVLNFTEYGGKTEVTIVGDARPTGMIARVGQRLIGSASKMLMNQFFECMKSKIDPN